MRLNPSQGGPWPRATNKGEKKVRRTLTVDVSFQDLAGDAKAPLSRMYQFDGAGRLVASKPVGKEFLTFQVDASQNYRFTLGPDLHRENRKVALDLGKTLARALGQDFIAAVGREKLIFHVPPTVYGCWYQVCVFMHGTVRKLLNPRGGGAPIRADLHGHRADLRSGSGLHPG